MGVGRLACPFVMVAFVISGKDAGVQPMQLSGVCRFCFGSMMPYMSSSIWNSSVRRPCVQSSPVLFGLRMSGKVPSFEVSRKCPFPAICCRPCGKSVSAPY